MLNNITQYNIKFAAVIVLYNPVDKVLYNIDSFLRYSDYLFITDNSEKNNEILLSSLKMLPNVSLIINNSNLGIAKTINLVVKKTIDLGYNYLLTMDQDSRFEEDALEKLLSKIGDESIGIYSPFHKNKYFTNPPHQDMEEVSDVMTSGNILNLEAVKKVGFFREDYFIDYVDVEYCLRLRKNGYKILRVNNSFLIHNEANLSRTKLFGKTIYPPNHKPFRWYYKIRNYLFLKEEYQKDFPEYFIKESKNIRNNIIKVLLFEESKIQKFKMMLKGYFHYKKRITGKLPE